MTAIPAAGWFVRFSVPGQSLVYAPVAYFVVEPYAESPFGTYGVVADGDEFVRADTMAARLAPSGPQVPYEYVHESEDL